MLLNGERKEYSFLEGPPFVNVWRQYWLSPLRKGVLLASSGHWPLILLYSLQYTAQDPITKDYPVQNVNSVKFSLALIKIWGRLGWYG